jgi:hypothetical protein
VVAEKIDAHRKRAQAEHGVTLTQMYNVPEKVRLLPSPLWGPKAGETGGSTLIEGGGRERSEQLDNTPTRAFGATSQQVEVGSRSPPPPAERGIFDRALILTLKHLHDELDTAVADAYGWPLDLPEAEVLASI